MVFAAVKATYPHRWHISNVRDQINSEPSFDGQTPTPTIHGAAHGVVLFIVAAQFNAWMNKARPRGFCLKGRCVSMRSDSQ